MDVRFCEGRNHRRETQVGAAGSDRVQLCVLLRSVPQEKPFHVGKSKLDIVPVARRNVIRREWLDSSRPNENFEPAFDQELLWIARTCPEPGHALPCGSHIDSRAHTYIRMDGKVLELGLSSAKVPSGLKPFAINNISKARN